MGDGRLVIDVRQLLPARPATPAPTPPDRVRLALLLAAGLLGVCASGYLAAAGMSLGTHLPGVHLWFYDSASLAPDRVGTSTAWLRTGLALAGLAVSWLMSGLAVQRGASTRALVLVAVATAVPLLIGPPLFSPDVYHYASVGAAMQHGVNPYVDGPGAAGDIAAVRGSEPAWRFTPSPYSPPFLQLLQQLSLVLGQNLIAVTVALRVLAVAAWTSLAFTLPKLAQRCGRDPRRAVWLGMANPLVLLHGVSAAHNDVLVVALLVPALLLLLHDRFLLAAGFGVAAGGVKVTALAAVGVIVVEYARRQTGWPAKLRALLLGGGIGAGGFLALVVASRLGWGLTTALSTPGLAVEPLSPPTALAVSLDAADPPLDAVRAAALAVGMLICAGLLTRLRSWGVVRVTGWVLVTMAAAGPALWPWYLLPPLVVFAAAGARREVLLMAGLSVALLGTVLPGGQATLSLLPRPLADHLVLAVLVALVSWGAAHALQVRRGRPKAALSSPGDRSVGRVAGLLVPATGKSLPGS
jgi:hypothetical protein